MLNICFKLFKEFCKIGLFSFGGGYSTLPFLYNISEVHNWYSIQELTQMLAISSITPGAVGVNMATYAGLKTYGLVGAFTSTISLVLPAIFLCILISKILKQFEDNFYVKATIYSLKPASCALICSVGIKLIKSSINSMSSIVLFLTLFLIFVIKKKSPLFYIVLSGMLGLFLNICKS